MLGSGSTWIYLFIYLLSTWLVSLVFCNRVSSIPGCPLTCYVVEIGFELLIFVLPPECPAVLDLYLNFQKVVLFRIPHLSSAPSLEPHPGTQFCMPFQFNL